MAIKPKDLNQTNKGYGVKDAYHAWQASLTSMNEMKKYYDGGGYSYAIERGIGWVKNFGINSIDSLSKMREDTLMAFYYMGKAYLEQGQIDNAIACFHIVYSQSGFEQRML